MAPPKYGKVRIPVMNRAGLYSTVTLLNLIFKDQQYHYKIPAFLLASVLYTVSLCLLWTLITFKIPIFVHRSHVYCDSSSTHKTCPNTRRTSDFYSLFPDCDYRDLSQQLLHSQWLRSWRAPAWWRVSRREIPCFNQVLRIFTLDSVLLSATSRTEPALLTIFLSRSVLPPHSPKNTIMYMMTIMLTITRSHYLLSLLFSTEEKSEMLEFLLTH